MTSTLEMNDSVGAKRKRGVAVDYEEVKRFSGEAAFDAWFSEETQWKKGMSRDFAKHRCEEYICKHSRKKNFACPMKLRVLHPHNLEHVIAVEQTKGKHDHNELGKSKFSEGDKELLRKDLDSTPLILQKKIQATRKGVRATPPPSTKQIKNFL